MAIDHKLLDILCCPATGNPVQPLKKDRLKQLNALVEQGLVTYMDGTSVETALQEALVTDNGERIYRVDDGIPVMLEDKAIPGQCLSSSR